MKNQTLKKLYDAINEENTARNPFLSEEARAEIYKFLYRYFKDDDTVDDVYMEMLDAIDAIQQSAFEKAFYIAFDLMAR